MKETARNLYGDELTDKADGHGADIASQRADDLDRMAVEVVEKAFERGERVLALDAACGKGAQAVRLARAGAGVVALDILDFSADLDALAKEAGCLDRVTFVQADMRTIGDYVSGPSMTVICSQRAIHYLSWPDAVAAVSTMASLLKPGGQLFLSASGCHSELGYGYAGHGVPVEKRFAPLSHDMAEKHKIRGDVCLYTEEEMGLLFREAGLQVVTVFSSNFGNIKGVARRRE